MAAEGACEATMDKPRQQIIRSESGGYVLIGLFCVGLYCFFRWLQ
jgi:hypothetical protein